MKADTVAKLVHLKGTMTHSLVLQEGAIPTAFAFASAVLRGNRAAGKGE